MAGLQYAGEFTLDACDITTSSGETFNLKGSVMEINIFEDIYLNSLSGTIALFDTQNFLSRSFIRGQDTLYILITTPSISDDPKKKIEGYFSVNKIDIQQEISSKGLLYQLSFVSNEFFKNERKKLSKAYQDSPTKIIESILTKELETVKPILFEASKNIKRVVFTNKKPFDAIRQIMQEAVSKINNSPSYLFYETTKGYYCRTLTNLYEQEVVTDFNAGEVALLDGEGQAKHPNPVKDFERVIDIDLQTNIDSLINQAIGILSSKLTKVNLYNKSMDTTEYRYFDDFNNVIRSEGAIEKDNPIYNDEPVDDNNNNIGDFVDSKTHLHTVIEKDGIDMSHYNTQNNINDYTFSKTELADKSFLTRQAKRREVDHMIRVKAHINGHVGFEAGQLCQITKPMKDESGKSIYQGKYLITALRHHFDVGSVKHEITLNMVKDSSPIPIEKSGPINFKEVASEKAGAITFIEDLE